MGVSIEIEPAALPPEVHGSAREQSVGEGRVSSIDTTTHVRVSGALLCACRAGFMDSGQWSWLRTDLATRMEIEPDALDRISVGDWLDLSSLTALLDAQLQYVDVDTLKTRVRRRVGEVESRHVYAPMLRSWTRSFASAEHMLRALGPLFRAGLRNVEVPLVRGMGSSEAHVLLRGALLSPLVGSSALRAAFEGLLLGLLDLARPRPMLPEVELSFDKDALCAVCHF